MGTKYSRGDITVTGSATEILDRLDELEKELGRKLCIYVIGHKRRSRSEVERLIKLADVAVIKDAWDLLDDRSRYEWVNR